MREIIELDDALSNKIAAGEVVERPSSVVKELAENAIDAGSTVIEIDIEEAGLGSIRVLDNGKGIGREDVKSAFKRHATSKIKDENDLFRIRTLGFRGEALPSIASVSHLKITTAKEGEPGTEALFEGGKLISEKMAGSRRGTDIVVTNLFFNTPARLKYIKSLQTEMGHITDILNRLALSHPEISFRLRHDGRQLLMTNGNGEVLQVLAAIYGTAVAKKMVKIEADSLDFKLSGYIALPEVNRASRNYLSTMVNGRFIRNFAIAKAIQEGYHTLLPIGRFPVALLSVELDPILVDVNVHPAKMEVRLSKEQELYELISGTIRAAFRKQRLIPDGQAAAERRPAPQSQQTSLSLTQRTEEKKPKWNFTLFEKEPLLPPEEMRKLYEPEADTPAKQELPPDLFLPLEVKEPPAAAPVEELPKTGEGPRVPRMYPIGQMHGTYIFAQNEEGLYIIDQHAAQERLKYEYFREKVGDVGQEVQDLLVPITLEFSTDEAVKVTEHGEALADVGIFLEEFGANSFIVRSHPQWFPRGEEKEIIEEMVEQVISMKKVDIKKLREEAAIMMSCKASIKANRHLRNDEIQMLLDDLREAEDPFTCPHGRPIIIHYSVREMEKMFKRIM